MMLVRLRLHRPQRRAQRRRLAAAGRTDDENHAVLVAQELADFFEGRRRHADLFERGHAFAVVEHAHHDLFAEQRPQRRHPEVDVRAVFRCRAEAAVLRQPLLRDVHARHDLQAGDQPFVDPLGQVHHFLEQAVEAMADEHALFHRLDVDVAGLALDGALHDQIDEVDDRRRLAAFLQAGAATGSKTPSSGLPRQRGLARGVSSPWRDAHRHSRRRHREIASGLRRRANQRLVRVAGFESRPRCRRASHDLLDAIAGLELEILDEAEEQRIRHRDGEQVLLEADRHADALERDVSLGIRMTAAGSGGFSARLTYGKPSWKASALAICFSVARFIRTSTTPTRSPVRLCSSSAMRRSSSVMRPAWIRHSPIFLRTGTLRRDAVLHLIAIDWHHRSRDGAAVPGNRAAARQPAEISTTVASRTASPRPTTRPSMMASCRSGGKQNAAEHRVERERIARPAGAARFGGCCGADVGPPRGITSAPTEKRTAPGRLVPIGGGSW